MEDNGGSIKGRTRVDLTGEWMEVDLGRLMKEIIQRTMKRRIISFTVEGQGRKIMIDYCGLLELCEEW